MKATKRAMEAVINLIVAILSLFFELPVGFAAAEEVVLRDGERNRKGRPATGRV